MCSELDAGVSTCAGSVPYHSLNALEYIFRASCQDYKFRIYKQTGTSSYGEYL